MALVKISNGVLDLVEKVTAGHRFPNQLTLSYDFTYIDISKTDPTRLSGMPVNMKLDSRPSDMERRDRGVFLKPGKFLKALYPDHDNDQISRLAAKLARELTGGDDDLYNSLQISDTPSRVYCRSHHHAGNLGSSCMRDKDESYFELFDYDRNMKILYMLDEDRYLIARALLHTKVHVEDSSEVIKLMDRVYVCNDNYENLFFRWARENGYHRKESQAADANQDYVSPDGTHRYLNLRIAVCSDEFERVPYMDTFTYYCSCRGALRTHGDYCYEDILNDTDGGTEDGVLVASYQYNCSNCDCGIREYDDYYSVGDYDIMCTTCFQEEGGHCDRCEEPNYSSNMSRISMTDGTEATVCDHCRDEYSECEVCNSYTEDGLKEVQMGVYSTRSEWCDDCIESSEVEFEYCDTCATHYPASKSQCPSCAVMDKMKAQLHNMRRMLERHVVRSKNRIHNLPGAMFFEGEIVKFTCFPHVRMDTLTVSYDYLGHGKGYGTVERWNSGRAFFRQSYEELVNRLLAELKEPEPVPEPRVIGVEFWQRAA